MLRLQEDDVKGPAGGTVSDTTRPPQARNRGVNPPTAASAFFPTRLLVPPPFDTRPPQAHNRGERLSKEVIE